ncbi:MAG TPA: hypothetical protein VJH97_01030 [Candidatus Nanoarchaeia archaeon]|nr:hypothetical protein [Candidatus Nanoarchaeia archaeon]
MVTTIQIRDSTKQILERIKELENRPTFDSVVTSLAEERLAIPHSFYGKGKGKITKFTREDRLRLHEH